MSAARARCAGKGANRSVDRSGRRHRRRASDAGQLSDRHDLRAGGVGKARLAMAVAAACAEQFTQVAIVELASVRDPEATVPLVATAFDVEQRQHLTLEQTIEEFVQDRPVLLLLDNCEHVLDTVAPLVQRLCRRCLRLTVLATSRERSGWPASPSICSLRCAFRPPRPAMMPARLPLFSCSSTVPPKRDPGSSWTIVPSGQWRRSAGGSTGCRWRSSWQRRGSARSASRR